MSKLIDLGICASNARIKKILFSFLFSLRRRKLNLPSQSHLAFRVLVEGSNEDLVVDTFVVGDVTKVD